MSGGENRLSNYAKTKNIKINTLKLRNLKTKFFNNYLKKNKLKPRAGVTNIIKFCKKNNIKLGLASSTSINNINSIFFALKNTIKKKDFDFIGNSKFVSKKNLTQIYIKWLLKNLI